MRVRDKLRSVVVSGRLRAIYVVTLLSLAMVISASCLGVTSSDGSRPAASLQTPRFELWIDEGGQIARFGIATPGFTAGLTLDDLESIGIQTEAPTVLEEPMLTQLTSAGVQHVEVAWAREGFDVYVNAEPALHLLVGEDEAAVAEGVEIARAFGLTVPFADLLPLVKSLATDVVVHLPENGESPIPVRDLDAPSGFVSVETPEPELVLKFSGSVDSDGQVTVLGLRASDIPGLGGDALVLDPTVVNNLSAAGVEEIGLTVNGDGIQISSEDSVLLGVNLGSEDAMASLGGVSTAFGGPDQQTLDLLTTYRLMDLDLNVSLAQ